ncbi:MAG TPA: protein-glutamate O-methyltransferase CheR, partial [Verrucomicrobiae bacterium]|nr:protein-glutamate O-methyltransferase CheR [Verrucomicrobiae bacterium]
MVPALPTPIASHQRPFLPAPEGTARLLRDIVHDHTGIFFETARISALLDKLEPLARERNCRSFLDYYYLLKLEGEVTGEWQRVMEALSVQETYFWREMDQVRTLVDVLAPQWFAKRRDPLRIWSAACATGDEPFTIAMALEEAGWFDRAPIEIMGSDASVNALEKARRGVYRERAFRALSPHLRDKYFQPVPHGWSISPRLLVRVRFQRANLVVPAEIAHLATAPIIFCRNVFIYFSHDAIRRTVGVLAEHMPADGHLFVGASESLLRITKQFDLHEIGGSFVYKRVPAAADLPAQSLDP